MGEAPEQKGALFSRVYVDMEAPAQDKSSFRRILEAYTRKMLDLRTIHSNGVGVSSFLKQEGGKDVKDGVANYLLCCQIHDLLDWITFLWRALLSSNGKFSADQWIKFVTRSLREENMAYSLDEKCGVHFFIDEEFERNRVSCSSCLDYGRYNGVRRSFEDAFIHLDRNPPDAKAAVRSPFESLEGMARLITETKTYLNRRMVRDKINPRLLARASDETEGQAVSEAADGLAEIVNSVRNYRHGAASEQPVAPSLTYAVFILSNTASFIRWLAEVDSGARE